MLRDDRLALVWLASTVDRQLSRADIDGVSIERATEALSGSGDIENELPLRVEGQLVYGLSHILNRRARYLVQDSATADRNLAATFRQLLSNSGSDVTNDGLRRDLELDLNAPFGVSSLSVEGGDAGGLGLGDDSIDMSVDIVERAEEEDLSRLEVEEEVEAPGAVMAENDLPSLDFGPDLEADLGSSSPPASDVATFPANGIYERVLPIDFGSDDEAQVVLAPVHGHRKRHLTVDEIVDVVRPARPPPHILRAVEQIDWTRQPRKVWPSTISLGPHLDQMLDPAWIADEMKRRRFGSMRDVSVETASEMGTNVDANIQNNDDDVDMGEGLGLGDEDFEFTANEGSQPESQGSDGGRPSTQDSMVVDEAEEDDAEARDAIIARRAIQTGLADGPTTFEQIPGTFNVRAKAAAFVELLVLAGQGLVDVRQDAAYGSIAISNLAN